MAKLLIFKTGTYPQGNWPKERVKKMVDAYDPETNIHAPIIVGHDEYSIDNSFENELAYGWVDSIEMDSKGNVFAEVTWCSEKVTSAIANGQLKYTSIEIYPFDEIDSDDSPYLKAVALLGKSTPAVPTTKVSLFKKHGYYVEKSKDEKILKFTRKLTGKEISLFSKRSKKAKEEKPMDDQGNPETIEEYKQQLADKEKEAAAFKLENETLKGQVAKFTIQPPGETAAVFFQKLVDGGKLPPAIFKQVVAVDEKLGDNEDARTEHRELFSSFSQIIDPSGKHYAQGGGDNEPEDLTDFVKEFQREHKIKSFRNAWAECSKKFPEKFKNIKDQMNV